jgi:curli biogenesis system outer membrane secretion channel CsgG
MKMFARSNLMTAMQSLPKLLAIFVLLNACSVKSTGEVKDDTTLTGETARLAEAGADYHGPEYTVGVLKFGNKTPSKALGVGEAATAILRTQLQAVGLHAILLDKDELGEQNRLQELQESGALKVGKRRADEGFDAIDYRLSGAITAYSEVEEGIDALLYQSKTRVARVTVDYALVDVATGKSLVAESGAGEYRKKTTGALGLGAKSSFDPNLRDGALRDALAKATNKMIAKLGSRPFVGVVLAVDEGAIIVRAGTRSHLGEGVAMNVSRPGADIVDPDTGEILGRRESKIGVIRLSRHQNERLSETTFVSGEMPKRGDIVTAAQESQ